MKTKRQERVVKKYASIPRLAVYNFARIRNVCEVAGSLQYEIEWERSWVSAIDLAGLDACYEAR